MPPLRTFVAIHAVATALACRHEPAAPAELGDRFATVATDSIVTLVRTSYSGYREATRFVIHDRSTWNAAWLTAHEGLSPEAPLPEVDFDAYVVLLAALGERPTGGYDILVDSIVLYDTGTIVYLTAVSPGARCFTTQALTQPVRAVRIPRREAMLFVERTAVHDCG